MQVTLPIYLAESGLCLTAFYAVYRLFLARETFHALNRFYLITSLCLSVLLPAFHVDLSVGDRSAPSAELSDKTDLSQSTAVGGNAGSEGAPLLSAHGDSDPIPDTSGSVRRASLLEFSGYVRREMAGCFFKPLPPVSYTRTYKGMGAGKGKGAGSPETFKKPDDRGGAALTLVGRVLFSVYLAGLFYFLARYLLGIVFVRRLLKRSRRYRRDGLRIADMERRIAPCCFFNIVLVNSRSYEADELEKIVRHEGTHIRQRHWIDLAAARGIAFMQWPNPFEWLFLRALQRTHEYLADAEVCRTLPDCASYRTLLLKQMVSCGSLELVQGLNMRPIPGTARHDDPAAVR